MRMEANIRNALSDLEESKVILPESQTLATNPLPTRAIIQPVLKKAGYEMAWDEAARNISPTILHSPTYKWPLLHFQ